MLVANTITGAATLFRREVAELALPFPDTPGLPFHDHWLGARGARRRRRGLRRPPALRLRPAPRRRLRVAVTHGERRAAAGAAARRGALLPRLPAAARCWREALLVRARRAACARASARALRALRRAPSARRRVRLAGRCGRCACSRAATRRSGARASCCPGLVWRRPSPRHRRAGARAGRAARRRSPTPLGLRAAAAAALAGARLTSRTLADAVPRHAPVVIEARGRREDLPHPAPPRRHAQGARAAPVRAPATTASCARCATSPSTSTRASSSGSSGATARARARC